MNPEPEYPTVLLRISPELVERLSKPREGVTWERWDFGKPDADGFYSPVIYSRWMPPESLWARLRRALAGDR
jgi:hypothetical protein